MTSSASATVTANNVQQTSTPLSASFTATPGSGPSPLEVDFDASASIGNSLSYAWDFDLDDDNDGTPDPLTVDATGMSPTHTFSADGSYTVTLSVTDGAGQQAQATAEIIVGSDPEDDPNTETVEASLGDDDFSVLGIGFAPFEAAFDASASLGTDLEFRWDFGDGSSADGAFVTHLYEDPGTYDVTLTITNVVGRTNTISKPVSVLPNLDVPDNPSNGVSPEWLNLKDTSTLRIDLGQPVPGLEYNWDFGDGSTGQGTQLNHRYSKLGMYELKLEVVDTAVSQNLVGGSLSTQQVTDDGFLLNKTWLPNHWREAPEASFSFNGPEGAGIPVGTAPMQVSFDASASEGESDLEYLWDFGDGTISNDASPSHSFDEGEYVVTLTVSDEWDQTDSYRAYIVSRNENFFGQLRIDYPTLPTLQGPDPNADIEALMRQAAAASAGSGEKADLPQALSEQDLNELVGPSSADGTRYDSTFPYVVHNSARLQRAIFRWSPWTNGPNGPYVFCKDNEPFRGDEGIHVYYNGNEWFPQGFAINPPVFLFRVDSNTNHPLYAFCYMVQFYNNTGGYGVQARSDNAVDISAVRYDYRYTFDSFSELRIPKVHLSIVADQMLPGDLASPHVTENTFTGDDGEQLALTVQVRESEAQGEVSFDLPVYAVDQNGARVDATGYFKAEIDGVDSDCGDCVMVDGKATMRVTIPVAKDASFDLTEFKLYAKEDCDFDRDWAQTTFGYLRGCSDVVASYGAPTGLQDVEPFPFQISPNALADFNTIAEGGDTEEREAFYENFADTSIKVVKFGLNFLPFISDAADLLGQAYNGAVGNNVDPVLVTFASAGLVLDTFTGGAGDITAIFKGGYKLSLDLAEEGVGGVLAKVLQEETQNLVSGAITARQFFDTLQTRFKTVVDFATSPGCGVLGIACASRYDEVALRIKNAQDLDNISSLGKLDAEYLKDPIYEDLSLTTRERLDDLAASVVSCALNIISQGGLTTQANPCPRTVTKDSHERITRVVATLDPQYIKGGTATTSAARTWTREVAGFQEDDPGHILANVLGGRGGVNSDNIVPILGKVNRGEMAQLERQIKNFVVEGKSVSVDIELKYVKIEEPDSLRPTEIIYNYTVDGDAKMKVLKNPKP